MLTNACILHIAGWRLGWLARRRYPASSYGPLGIDGGLVLLDVASFFGAFVARDEGMDDGKLSGGFILCSNAPAEAGEHVLVPLFVCFFSFLKN